MLVLSRYLELRGLSQHCTHQHSLGTCVTCVRWPYGGVWGRTVGMNPNVPVNQGFQITIFILMTTISPAVPKNLWMSATKSDGSRALERVTGPLDTLVHRQ